MARFCNLSLVAAAIVLLAVTHATGADPVDCTQAQTMDNVNMTQFIGAWYEVARNPAPASTLACVQLNMAMADNDTMTIQMTYANDVDALYVNQTMSANVTVTGTLSSPTDGYNVSYSLGTQSTPMTTMKLLSTDYTNYALVCGYTNATDNSTSFGVVLTRQRTPNETVLNGYEMMGAANWTNFLNGSMELITQSDSCYNSGAATSLPLLSAVLAALFALLKFAN